MITDVFVQSVVLALFNWTKGGFNMLYGDQQVKRESYSQNKLNLHLSFPQPVYHVFVSPGSFKCKTGVNYGRDDSMSPGMAYFKDCVSTGLQQSSKDEYTSDPVNAHRRIFMNITYFKSIIFETHSIKCNTTNDVN